MKKIILVLVCIEFFLWIPDVVYAHTLKIDKNIGTTVHIDPDDTPIAGSDSKIFVEIEDKSGRFNVSNPENCDCRITIVRNGLELKTLPVVTGGRYNQLRYVFPTSGVYHLILTGKPTSGGIAFQEFRTDFEYYIKPGISENRVVLLQKNPLRDWVLYIVAAAGGAIVLLFVL